jgi:hypothetical protein
MEKELEEAAENHQKNVIGIALPKHTFIAGAKWMQQQMEELKDFDVWKEWKNQTFKSE